jgi:putative intracellular protease/amidase
VKKVLIVLSEFGYWGEELIGPLELFDKTGYQSVFATPRGKKPHPLPPSMDPDYIDPPLQRLVTSKETALKVKALDESDRLENPVNLENMMPGRPYLSSPGYLDALEEYYRKLEEAENRLREYNALLLVGGSGPIVDMVNNQRVHDIILAFYKTGRPIAAECYGIACLAFARDYESRRCILTGKHVTGHPLEYDYKDGTGFLGTDFIMGPPPYPLEFILIDAVGPDGQFHGNVGKTVSAIVDYPFITGRSTADSYKTGELLIRVLDEGLRRYGF